MSWDLSSAWPQGSLKLSIPEILLLDEPTIFPDICYQFEVLELNRSLGIATAMVLHDLNQAARYAHTIAALSEGMIVETGYPSAIITPALLERIFRIRVDVRNDAIHACPYFIPIESLHNRITDESQAKHGRREENEDRLFRRHIERDAEPERSGP